MRRKSFGSRVFGGRRYWFAFDADTKLVAKNFAARSRREGKRARVTQEKDMQGRKYYIVWVLRRR